MPINDLDELKLVREVHGETGELIARLYEALPGVMAHHFLKYDYWTQVNLIQRLREVLKEKELEDLEKSHQELTELAQENLKEYGDCDHSVNICSCIDQAKLRFALMIRARIDKVPWCDNCGTEGKHTIETCPLEAGIREEESQ